MDLTKDFWQPLGQDWWEDAAREVSPPGRPISRRQIVFACASSGGKTHVDAAAVAGYSGNRDSLKAQGHRVFRSEPVQMLLAKAAAAKAGQTGVEGVVGGDEARRIASRLARNGSAQIQISALKLLSDLDAKGAELGRANDTDGFSDWRMTRDFLQMPNGGPAIVWLWKGLGHALGSLPLLHDVCKAVNEADPDLWQRLRGQESQASREWLDHLLANPDWQREARIKLWKEVGVELKFAAPASDSLAIDIEGAADARSAIGGEAMNMHAAEDDADTVSDDRNEAGDFAQGYGPAVSTPQR